MSQDKQFHSMDHGVKKGMRLTALVHFRNNVLLTSPDMISNQLKTEILKNLVERYKNDERIQFFVHDKVLNA